MVERSKTNSNPISRNEMPAFVRNGTPAGANGRVALMDSNSTPLVIVARYGGFESIGVVIGPASYVETFDRVTGIISKQAYPGVYVRALH
jgi:hypothetical protein